MRYGYINYSLKGGRRRASSRFAPNGSMTHGFPFRPDRNARGVAAVCSLLLVCLSSAPAQTSTASLAGRVFDPSGGVVPGARVEALEQATERRHAVSADDLGRYGFPLLPVGEYELRATAPGLRADPVTVRLSVGRRGRVDMALALETEQAQVEISDATPLLEPENTALGAVISRAEIAHLPLNERSFLQLALLSAGTLPAAPGSQLSRQNSSGLHVGGAREAANNFSLDGVDNNDLYINRLVVSPPLDSIREFRLHAANYRAEYGRSGGAQIHVVSQSGSNRFHGSLYDYLRHHALDARNFFDAPERPIPQFRRNQFGASLGGPVRRAQTFFFSGYEGTRVRDGVTKTARVPGLLQRGGDFSDAALPLIDPFTQQPFPGHRIPAERIDPIARALVSRWPVPNRSGAAQNFVSAPRGDLLVNQFYGKIDHFLSLGNALHVRYNFSHDRGLEPFNDDTTNVPGFGSFILNRGQNLVVSDTHVFGPATAAELRFGFNRLRREVLQENIGRDVAGELGIAGIPSDPLFSGFPAINVGGFDSLADNTSLPTVREDQTFHWVANLTSFRGGHIFKGGGEYRFFSDDGIQAFFGRGEMNFLGAFTQRPAGDFLLGLPTFTIQTVIDNPFRQRASSWNGFFQDDWRITPRLTLNLGLRYEWNRPATDAEDRFMTYDPEAMHLVRAGAGGVPRAGFHGDHNNFAPRIGLGWSPRAADDLVLRAGWGVFYDTTILEANSGLYFNPPFFSLRLFFPSPPSLPTLANPFPSDAGLLPPPTVFAMAPNFRTAYLQHGSVSLEKTLPGRTVFRAVYAASKGTKLLRQRDINQPPPGEGPTFLRQPIPGFANIILFESAASSIYHSAQVSLERRFTRGLSYSLGGTVSKSIDDASAFLSTEGDPNFPQNSRDLRSERGLSAFDRRVRFVAAASYALPFEKHWAAKGWRIDWIGAWQSGPPLTPQLSFDNSNTGNTGAIAGADRPDIVGDPAAGAPTPERFFNTDAFATPAPFTFGNAGRNILIGPGSATVDLAVGRSFRFEKARIDIRAEAFNLFNRTNFDLPGRIADQPGFGAIASARSARQIQFSLRWAF